MTGHIDRRSLKRIFQVVSVCISGLTLSGLALDRLKKIWKYIPPENVLLHDENVFISFSRMIYYIKKLHTIKGGMIQQIQNNFEFFFRLQTKFSVQWKIKELLKKTPTFASYIIYIKSHNRHQILTIYQYSRRQIPLEYDDL